MNVLDFLPVLVISAGAFLLIKLRFFFILHPLRCFKELKRSLSSVGAFSSLMLSLSGTLGVGNIVGVAYGISIGGAGSVFWLLVSALFSSVLKFAESAISSDMKDTERGGIMYVIKRSFKGRFRKLSFLYAALCLMLSLTMGSALQARSAIESLSVSPPHTQALCALCFTVAVAAVILGGSEKIVKASSVMIPLASVIYTILTLSVIIINIEKLPSVISLIFTSAFNFKAGAGGVGAFFISSAIREGFSRGLLSNEAGAGTSSIAHARNQNSSAVSVGLVGMCEVFFDTVVLCTLTAFAVLLSGASTAAGLSGIEIVSNALSCIGVFSTPLLSFCVTVFAYSTVICWYYYGETSLSFITKKGKVVFPLVFLLSVFLGALTPSGFLIIISDYILFSLTVISLSAVIKNSDRLVCLSENHGLISKRVFWKGASHRKKQEKKAFLQAQPRKEVK